MADSIIEESPQTEKTTVSEKSMTPRSEKDDESVTFLNTEDNEIINGLKQGARTDTNGLEGSDAGDASCEAQSQIQSDDSSPVKTGFLRSFMEKRHLSAQSLESPETSEEKIESTNEKPKSPNVKEDITSLCKWQDCSVIIKSRSELSHHVHQCHVEPMTIQDVFVCLWQGCKVFNKPSCSHSWLAKHMNSHTGDKPFKCMIDGCTMSFASCEGLSRHVSAHFNEPKTVKRQRGEAKESPKKHLKKRRVRMIRKSPAEVKEDFVNVKTVETIKKQLPHMMPVCYEIGIDGTKIILQSKVLGKRVNEKSGETDILLHWLPDDLIPDEWISIDDYEKNKSKVVHLSSLPNHILAELDPAFYRSISHRKHKRK